MKEKRFNRNDLKITKSPHAYTRRDFIKKTALGSSALFVFGNLGVLKLAEGNQRNTVGSMIVVDYSKCRGCRTCEAVCSAFNNKQNIEGEMVNGLGNPYYANRQVHHYNPDVDIPAVCVMCPDNPCIEACPVPPDSETGRKALYRDDKNLTIMVDPQRCIGCRRCVNVCSSERVGIIKFNRDANKPERLCTLCDGNPKCVKYCPGKALSHIKVETGREFYGMSPDQIAMELIESWYGIRT